MPNAIQRCLLTLLLHFTFLTTDVHKTFAAPVLTDVSTTSSQMCAVISGSAWCMGNNSFGQLGNGTTTSTKSAVRVIRFDNKPLTGVTAIETSSTRSCAIALGQVWCWGNSFIYGQSFSTKAKLILTTDGKPFSNATHVSIGYSHACALSRGQVWCWGNNQMGQGGVGQYEDIIRAKVVRTNDSTILTGVSKIATGFEHSCAIANKRIYCWGSNEYGQIGNLELGYMYSSWLATKTQPSLLNTTDISAGEKHTCAIDTTQVYCWGDNEYGAIGGSYSTSAPIQVFTSMNTPLNNVTALSDIDSYSHTTCAIKSGNQWCWGENRWRSLGDGTAVSRSRAVLSRINNIPIRGISHSSTSNSTCVIATNQLWCWGYLRWQHDYDSRLRPYRLRYSTGNLIP